MDKEEFKLGIYFQKYKDLPIYSRDIFRCRFIRENGHYKYLNELIFRVEKYQIKKYGETLSRGQRIDNKSTTINERARKSNRFGNKIERESRKIIYEKELKNKYMNEVR